MDSNDIVRKAPGGWFIPGQGTYGPTIKIQSDIKQKIMITAEELNVGDKVSYYDCGERTIARVMGKDDDRKLVFFMDTDEFKWEEKYQDIPETVRKVFK